MSKTCKGAWCCDTENVGYYEQYPDHCHRCAIEIAWNKAKNDYQWEQTADDVNFEACFGVDPAKRRFKESFRARYDKKARERQQETSRDNDYPDDKYAVWPEYKHFGRNTKEGKMLHAYHREIG